MHQASVGIIANPASGSDIRRLVAMGTVFGTQEKINIVQRIMVGLHAAGIDRFYLMPDLYGIGNTALARLPKGATAIRERAQLLDIAVVNGPEDSVRAAQKMRELGVGCIVVLGGDGTNRVVAKGSGDIPLMSVSTGTNNVIPYLIEGTVAGLAAGFVARHPDSLPEITYRSKWLEILREGQPPDGALVDVAVVQGSVIGTRAIWDPKTVRQVIMTRAEPGVTGISSLGGFSSPVGPTEPRGLCLWLGEPKIGHVTAPLAPGLIRTFGIEAIQDMAIGDSVIVSGGNRLLALDGERELVLHRGQDAQIILRDDGPWLVDVHRALQVAAERGVFVEWAQGRLKHKRPDPTMD